MRNKYTPAQMKSLPIISQLGLLPEIPARAPKNSSTEICRPAVGAPFPCSGCPRSTEEKGPRATRAMRGKTLETVPFQPYFGCSTGSHNHCNDNSFSKSPQRSCRISWQEPREQNFQNLHFLRVVIVFKGNKHALSSYVTSCAFLITPRPQAIFRG